MSWAALLQSNKDKPENFDAPVQRVYATDSNVDDVERKLNNLQHDTADVSLPVFTKGLLVLDANAIIKGMDNFVSIADAFVTTSQVIAEIRDRASRELLERLPHTVTVLDPTQASITAVVECAEKTGDLGVLSRTDIRLCALALDACRAANCMGNPIVPHSAQVNASGTIHTVTDLVSDDDDENGGEEKEEEEEQGENAEGGGESEGDKEKSAKDVSKANRLPGWGGNDADDEGEWITPENIHEIREGGNSGGNEVFSGGVACVTSDYAMQNTLLHLGVPLVGTSGMRISELRLWLLRCTSCFTIVIDTTRQFCPSCGSGDTLRRVSYRINKSGEKQLYVNFKKQISTRGTVYNLPKPRGGKRGTNRSLVLREDQLAQVIRGKSGAEVKKQQAAMDSDELAAFGEPVRQKKRNLGDPKSHSSYHKYNINEKKKARAAHRK